jgi:hypothetical protein
MAFTWTIGEKTTFGNKRVFTGTVVADSTAGYITTGMNSITWVSYAPKSITTYIDLSFGINKLDSGTATAGALAITGVTSGDELYVTVYGN